MCHRCLMIRNQVQVTPGPVDPGYRSPVTRVLYHDVPLRKNVMNDITMRAMTATRMAILCSRVIGPKSLSPVFCLLSPVSCFPSSVSCLLSPVFCLLFSVLCFLSSVSRSRFPVSCSQFPTSSFLFHSLPFPLSFFPVSGFLFSVFSYFFPSSVFR